MFNSKNAENFITFIKKNLGCYVKDIILSDSIYFLKINSSSLINLLVFLKKHTLLQFKFLFDISASINYKKNNDILNLNKFSIYYYLSSYRFNIKFIIYTQIFDEKIFIKSVCSIYKSSIWLEREVWDMFGIFFSSNPDLRRILTDYGFKYNPLLKEYPVKGFFELKYYTALNVIQYVPVKDLQEAKVYDFKNPWKFF